MVAYGRDPFNQNFRKFRSKTQWIGSVQPEKFRKNGSTFWGGPLFSVGPVGILVEWIAPYMFCLQLTWPRTTRPCSLKISITRFPQAQKHEIFFKSCFHFACFIYVPSILSESLAQAIPRLIPLTSHLFKSLISLAPICRSSFGLGLGSIVNFVCSLFSQLKACFHGGGDPG